MFEALRDPALDAAMLKAGRPLDTARGTKAAELIRRAKQDAVSFVPMIRARTEKAKN